jgi:hypothetical protein
VTRIPIGYAVESLAVGEGAAWSTPGQSNVLIRVDEATNEVRTFRFHGEIARPPVVAYGSVWIGLCTRPETITGNACRRMWVLRLDPDTAKVLARIRLPGRWPEPNLAVGDGVLWALNWFREEHAMVRIDPTTNRIAGQVRVPTGASAPSWGFGSLWLLSGEPARVVRLDPSNGRVEATIRAYACRRAIMSDDSVWINTSCYLNKPDELLRIDPDTNRIVARISLPRPMNDLIAASGWIWLFRGNLFDSTVHIYRLDPSTSLLQAGEIPIEPSPGPPNHGVSHSYSLQAAASASTLWVTYLTDAEVVRIDFPRN